MDDLKWLIAREIPHLRRFATALVAGGGRDIADDLVQECLERALRKRRSWRGHGSLRSWLFRILYRSYLDHLRRRESARAVPLDEVYESDDRESTGRGDIALISQANQEHRLECLSIAAALDTLPRDQRAAILLVALEGLAYDEAAEVLGVPVGTLRSRLSRGRESLRRIHRSGTVRLRRVK